MQMFKQSSVSSLTYCTTENLIYELIDNLNYYLGNNVVAILL